MSVNSRHQPNRRELVHCGVIDPPVGSCKECSVRVLGRGGPRLRRKLCLPPICFGEIDPLVRSEREHRAPSSSPFLASQVRCHTDCCAMRQLGPAEHARRGDQRRIPPRELIAAHDVRRDARAGSSNSVLLIHGLLIDVRKLTIARPLRQEMKKVRLGLPYPRHGTITTDNDWYGCLGLSPVPSSSALPGKACSNSGGHVAIDSTAPQSSNLALRCFSRW